MNPWTAKFVHVDSTLCFSDAVPLWADTPEAGVCVDHDRMVKFNPLYGCEDD